MLASVGFLLMCALFQKILIHTVTETSKPVIKVTKAGPVTLMGLNACVSALSRQRYKIFGYAHGQGGRSEAYPRQ